MPPVWWLQRYPPSRSQVGSFLSQISRNFQVSKCTHMARNFSSRLSNNPTSRRATRWTRLTVCGCKGLRRIVCHFTSVKKTDHGRDYHIRWSGHTRKHPFSSGSRGKALQRGSFFAATLNEAAAPFNLPARRPRPGARDGLDRLGANVIAGRERVGPAGRFDVK